MKKLAGLLVLLLTGCDFFSSSVVLPSDYQVDGRDSSTLSAEWWQWAMAFPRNINPVRDNTGIRCAVGQRGDVWFLAGGFGSAKIHRNCTVPADKYLFFPVVNMSYWPESENNGMTCDTVKHAAALNNDTAIDLFAELDGEGIDNVKNYRVASRECFNIFKRRPASLGGFNAHPSASDGYWLLLKPLSKGTHTLKFGGRYNNQSSEFGRMVQDIEYTITVQ